ncbi:DNA/RNA helicase domain-containing protein [Bacillus cereus]|uniref:DNA/RNA helicase domain-containing protein n=1 Tax=Bacillus cereus TaxID=1396 RepID=UPI0001A0FB19|nr:hypothetical protein bcere0022_48250 [Bacillus cereus Rock3-44]
MKQLKQSEQFCCYKATVGEFLSETNVQIWIDEMLSNFKDVYPELNSISEEQRNAWEDCFICLQNSLEKINPDYFLIFEYRLKYEGGRRPDVILLTDNEVVILEFKEAKFKKQTQVDQVIGYAQDIKFYHCESRGMIVKPVVVLTGGNKNVNMDKRPNNYEMTDSGVQICGVRKLEEYLLNNVNGKGVTVDQVNRWLESESSLLPNVMEACEDIFDRQLERLQSVSNPALETTLEYIKGLSNKHWEALKEKAESRTHMVVFVTGVPGAGKTLLAMRLVNESRRKSIYVTGNGPLLEVLSYRLDKEYEKRTGEKASPSKQCFKNVYNFEFEDSQFDIVAFDEGQRVWNMERMSERRQTKMSESDLILKNLEENRERSILFVFVGEGQAIHAGEKNNISLWVDALNSPNRSKEWKVLCPPKLNSAFVDCRNLVDDKERDLLDIKTSIRQHRVKNLNVGELINTILDFPQKVEEINNQVKQLDGFNIYLTKDVNLAKKHCEEVYEKSVKSRYGLTASSKGDKFLKKYDINCSYDATKDINTGAWYYENKGTIGSCCNFDEVTTEFQTQGLELDMPIVCWSDDLLWCDGWKPKGKNEIEKAYRINAYRVLLTRGRDGLIIYVPNEQRLEGVYNKWKELLGEERILKGGQDGNI